MGAKMLQVDELSVDEKYSIDYKLLISTKNKELSIFNNIQDSRIKILQSMVKENLCFLISDNEEILFSIKNTSSNNIEDTAIWINSKNVKNNITEKKTRQNLIKKEKLPKFVLNLQAKKTVVKSGIIVSIVTLFFVTLAFHSSFSTEYPADSFEMKSKYLVQNLRGDTIDTWYHWNIPEDRTLYVSIQNSKIVSQEKLEIIKSAILSEETILIDDSLLHKGPKGSESKYYFGWKGAIEEARKESTLYSIPSDFKLIESSSKSVMGDIIISLTNLRDPEGYSGFTKSIVEENQILKSVITVYQANELSENGLATIVRHEFGHSLGLIHSTAPEDLMASVITTGYPFVSECAVDAITSLYNGNELSEVVCEK